MPESDDLWSGAAAAVLDKGRRALPRKSDPPVSVTAMALGGHEVTVVPTDAALRFVQANRCLCTLTGHGAEALTGQDVALLLDDPRAAVWQEAGNRLHAQKALLEFLLLGRID